MDQDSQSCIETGWRLTCSNNVADGKKEEPHRDKEALQESNSRQTQLDAQAGCMKKPHLDTEAENASYSQHSQLDSQAHCEKKPHLDTEAKYASDSYHTQLHAQAYREKKLRPDTEDVYASHSKHTQVDKSYCGKKSIPDTEAQCEEQPYGDVKAQCKDGFSSYKNDNVQVFKEPRPDEEAGLNLDNEVHYDRGWAWVVLGTTFLMEFFVGGLITSSGVIYAALVDEFNKSRSETGKPIFTFSIA